MFARSFADGFAKEWIREHTPKQLRTLSWRSGVKQDPLVMNHLRQRSGIRSQHRCTLGHGLQHRKAEAFVEGGKVKYPAPVIEHGQCRVIDFAENANAIAQIGK